ncbi:MAG: coenzyme F420-0:L-glutamate ligase [Acidimicrobiia bacterium]|nr:coenzyme F420-0:L-glutamate ligase [Acidimicrobiia bacterium]
MLGNITLIPVVGVPEIRPGDDLARLILAAAQATAPIADGDCLVVTQKVVSKAEGRLVAFDGSDESKAALIARESRRVIRRRGALRIAETNHGFVCANAGIDLSNVEAGFAALLPVDSDRSARRIRDVIASQGTSIGVIISDTFGRPWRRGVTDVAIGVAGIKPVIDLRGTNDALGRELAVTEVCIADEVAAAAELVMGKSTGVAAAIVRGLNQEWFGPGDIGDVIRPAQDDLFR